MIKTFESLQGFKEPTYKEVNLCQRIEDADVIADLVETAAVG